MCSQSDKNPLKIQVSQLPNILYENLYRQNLHFADPDQEGQMNAAFMQIRNNVKAHSDA